MDFLRAPLSELIVPEAQVLVPPEAVRGWRVDPADLRALTSYGLPAVGDENLVPAARPAPTGLTCDGDEIYQLGTEWRQTVGVVAGSGRVVRVTGTGPIDVMLVNTTLASFVESAWRYLWLFLQEGGRADDRTLDVLDAFLARMRQIDPAIGDDPDASYWPSIVEYW